MKKPSTSLVFVSSMVVLGASAVLAQTATTPAERPLTERIQGRTFPSVFQAWSPAQNVQDDSPLHTVARHDLVFHGPEFFGLRWNRSPTGLADGFTAESIGTAKSFRQKLLTLNPNLVLIAEIRYRDSHKSYLPDEHKWWLRDEKGEIVPGWDEGGFLCLDFHNPEFRSQVARQAKAAVGSGAVDGVMLDWWSDDASRLALIQEVREAVGKEAIILANANDRQTPQTAPYINGYFMECYKSQTAKDWQEIADTLAWAEAHLREPRVNCLETWFHKSRDDLNLMRATTTLALTHSDGYCLFSDPNPLPTPDHLHNWYKFWNKSLGKPVAKGKAAADGSVRREFENGTVVYNPMGNKAVSVMFPEERRSAATGKVARSYDLESPDGDIFLKVK
ncbi:MAG: putative glycoside hydrolase [Pirellulaceae bacterium]